MFEEFAIRVRDDKGGVSETEYIRVTITGTNDAPTLAAFNSDGTDHDSNLIQPLRHRSDNRCRRRRSA